MHKVNPHVRHEWMKGRHSRRLMKAEGFQLNLEHVYMLVAEGASSTAKRIFYFCQEVAEAELVECAVHIS